MIEVDSSQSEAEEVKGLVEEEKKHSSNKKKEKKRIERRECEGIVFAGYDCVDQFVQWIISEGILRLQPLSSSNKYKERGQDYVRDFKNIFIAHNGARFDFRFIISRLSKYSSIDIVGTKNQIKKLKFKNLEFIDTV